MKIIVGLPFILLGVTNATCPNSCSGHGTCGVDDICTCYSGWGMGGKGGGDCSDRFCPYELAWVDGPTSTGEKHNYAECANKGSCDREAGECECFSGFEGKGCGRQSCPNNCNGHGTCEFMKDLEFGKTYSEYHTLGLGSGGTSLVDYSWDTDRARTCVCDPGYSGIDCMLRMCPIGKDIMDVILSGESPQIHKITLYDQDDDNSNFDSQTFALQFTSKKNETFATQPIAWSITDGDLETSIEEALVKLPNKVVDEVEVTVDSSDSTLGVIIEITFSGSIVEGEQHMIEVLTKECSEGCTPRITGLSNLRTWHLNDVLSKVEISDQGSHNSHECGRRGKCDYVTGLCSCYDGYMGDACNIFNSIG